MEMIAVYTSIAVFCGATLFFCAWRVLNWVCLKPKKIEKQLREQGLRGNPYKLLYGDFKEISTMLNHAKSNPIHFSDDIVPRVIPHYQEAVKKFGKKSYIWLGPKPSVLIMDPELIKEIIGKNFLYEKPYSNPLFRYLVRGVANYEGDKWAKHRKILNPAFHQDKLKLMLPAFYASASEILSKWENIVSPKGSGEVDVWPYLQTLTSDAISRTAFGSNYEEGRRIFELQREQTQQVMMAVRSVYIPGWRFLPTKMNRKMKKNSNNVKDSIRSIINSRIKAMKEGKACEDDLLGILLESNSKEIDHHGSKNFGLTIEEVIEECKLFYLAGQETTSVLLTWTMILLSQYPHWQTRAREEVLQLFGPNKLDFEGLNHLKIVTMILYEVLRLFPPFPVLNRKTSKETRLGNLTLPSGVVLALPTMLLHHNAELWGDDVKEFNPERFVDGVSHATKGKVSFFPFGWGPRICIGLNFALLEAKLTLAMVLQRFSFELSPSYTHAPISILTLQPQHGAHLILQKI